MYKQWLIHLPISFDQSLMSDTNMFWSDNWHVTNRWSNEETMGDYIEISLFHILNRKEKS